MTKQTALKEFLSSKIDLHSYILAAKDGTDQWCGYYDADIDDGRDSVVVFEAETKLLELLVALSSVFKMIEHEIESLHKLTNIHYWKGLH